jgi:flagellar hook protein FlgE
LASTYYVKIPQGNTWELYSYVDGVDVSAGTLGRGSSYLLEFDTTGGLSTIDGVVTPPSTLTTSTFTPVSVGGASIPAPMQLTLDYGTTTQYGSPFSVNALSQDGYSVGRLSTISIDADGIVFARYSNGRALAQGQVALVNFANPNGLSPLGDSSWGETSDSGVALIGAPNTSSLGAVQSGALEGSNVDLSRELVNMILAQRDFQANAKMISTEDAVTQTIINIR